MGFFSRLIGTLCAAIVVTGGVVCAVPETRTKMADYVADKFSPAYAEIKDDNAKKDSQIKDLNKDIDSLNKAILEKDTSIAQKDKLITEKDSTIASQTEQLNTCNANIKTLSSQKVTLLTAVSEIDNKINSTTDSVELEDLETRKTAILAQIDTLNTQISTLQAQKTQLEQDIATLQQEKATLQAEVNQLKHDKAELQNQKTTLQEQVNNFSKVTTITLENYPGCMMPDPISIIDTITNINYATNNSNVQSATVFNISGNLKFSLGYSFSSVGEKYYIYVDGVKQPYQMGYNFEFLADGLNHTIKFEAPTMVSKWKLNSQISTDTITSDKTFKINGCVDGRFYFDCLYFNVGDSLSQSIYIENSPFGAGPSLSDFCNTNICFETEPTGELLTWLQTNATKVTEVPTVPTNSLTWKLNNTVDISSILDEVFEINFTANGTQFTSFATYSIGPDDDKLYNLDFTNSSNSSFNFYSSNPTSLTIDENYRNIIFETEPTGDLLTWLQANATQVAE